MNWCKKNKGGGLGESGGGEWDKNRPALIFVSFLVVLFQGKWTFFDFLVSVISGENEHFLIFSLVLFQEKWTLFVLLQHNPTVGFGEKWEKKGSDLWGGGRGFPTLKERKREGSYPWIKEKRGFSSKYKERGFSSLKYRKREGSRPK